MENNKENIETGWSLDNSYMTLADFFYSKINLNPVPSPKLVILNYPLAQSLGLNIDNLKSKDGVELLSGNKKIDEGAFIAQAYAGHQFGHFTMLGDGRALLIGEQINPSGDRFDIQLKGSGKTPYSRGGDGRAVIGPMLREYIISEAMYGLGIPTTRSLAVVKTGETVIRESIKEGAILTRVASSHIRFGTFEYAANFGGVKRVKELADYTIKRHYSHIKDNKEKYINLLKEVINAHGVLVAKWQSIGFIHGVMNTDNMTISGESIDYGPCAFMDSYKPDTVFSSIDRYGRYSYENQPNMAEWNLCRFVETLLPLISDDKKEAIKIAQDAISKFSEIYHINWITNMRAKLGLFTEELQDKALIEDLLSMMEKYNEDFTNTFIELTFDNVKGKGMFSSEEFKNWYNVWKDRLNRQPNSKEEVYELMKKSNPAVIPRNHRVEEALSDADKGDFNTLKNLLDAIERPYEHCENQKKYSKPPKISNKPYRTYCGT
ncbi:protein adenylyltransferase SelO [Paraclostridium ghonii]|uniref:protein adenylyltransferase SelO n=1 Tax=Paraclostridium ghonii TaxID=29358 RepID=UPI00202D0623|nr:YdiU family protein [Paeniclostridium ghonii]MCM0166271.1 YdiU family protein [Paeniclostridium ghonii]